LSLTEATLALAKNPERIKAFFKDPILVSAAQNNSISSSAPVFP
jgi:hypothetical protein